MPRNDPTYQRHKARAAARQARISASGRDIAPLPPVRDPARRIACSRDFRRFCETYFSHTFTLAWSADHLRMITHIERAVLEGGTFAMAMPRGCGKTSLCETAALWALLLGEREFLVLLGADELHAQGMLDSIKTELTRNDVLAEDFPEVTHPIRCLENVSQKARAQLFNGALTHITWADDVVVLPTIPGSKASGAIIRVKGLGGSIRGMKFKRPSDGGSVRPSLVIIDDPQTDESARSTGQCASRERLISGAVMGMAGPGRKIAAVMPCTVITPGDLADRLLDRKKHPEWQGERTKLVYEFPTDTKLWEQYAEIFRQSLRDEHGGREATEFYAAHREAMDAGARVAWPQRFNPDELSAIQHAMNLKIRDEEAFFAEYQNDPREPATSVTQLKPDEICQKLSGVARGIVPAAATKITAFIDVHDQLLYWMVCAWAQEEIDGWVLDYGTFPQQPSRHFTLRQANPGLSQAFPGLTKEAAIRKGLESLVAELKAREWKREDGTALHLDKLLIDQRYAQATVQGFVRWASSGTLIFPAMGIGITASGRPMTEYKFSPGELLGHHWMLKKPSAPGMLRHVLHDANYWKTFVHSRLSLPSGTKGALLLYGSAGSGTVHRLLSEHLHGEFPTPTEGRGRKLVEWRVRPGGPDVHWLDCLCGCAVAASVCGCGKSLTGRPPPRPVKRGSRSAVYL